MVHKYSHKPREEEKPLWQCDANDPEMKNSRWSCCDLRFNKSARFPFAIPVSIPKREVVGERVTVFSGRVQSKAVHLVYSVVVVAAAANPSWLHNVRCRRAPRSAAVQWETRSGRKRNEASRCWSQRTASGGLLLRILIRINILVAAVRAYPGEGT